MGETDGAQVPSVDKLTERDKRVRVELVGEGDRAAALRVVGYADGVELACLDTPEEVTAYLDQHGLRWVPPAVGPEYDAVRGAYQGKPTIEVLWALEDHCRNSGCEHCKVMGQMMAWSPNCPVGLGLVDAAHGVNWTTGEGL